MEFKRYEILIRELSRHYQASDEIEYTFTFKILFLAPLLALLYILSIILRVLGFISGDHYVVVQSIALLLGLTVSFIYISTIYSWNKHVERISLLFRTTRDLLDTLFGNRVENVVKDIDALSVSVRKMSYYWIIPQLTLALLMASLDILLAVVSFTIYTIVICFNTLVLRKTLYEHLVIETKFLDNIMKALDSRLEGFEELVIEPLNITSIILSIVTLGVYVYVLLAKLNKRLREHYLRHRDVETNLLLRILRVKPPTT